MTDNYGTVKYDDYYWDMWKNNYNMLYTVK